MQNFQLVTTTLSTPETLKQALLLQEIQKEDFRQKNGKFSEQILNDVDLNIAIIFIFNEFKFEI